MNYDLLIDLHKGNKRQGPGGDKQTIQALQLADLAGGDQPLKIADIGCGTGSSTLILAENVNASITAVDLFQDFLDILNTNAKKRGIADKITTLKASMEELPFAENSLDAIWAEGAIYNMGFAKGVEYLKRFLKPGGILSVSEITWLTQERPTEIQQYWDASYPEIATASDKIKALEAQRFILKGYFLLPTSCWIDNYYTPLENTYDTFLNTHNSEEARTIVEAEKAEIALYKTYQDFLSYGFYIAQHIQHMMTVFNAYQTRIQTYYQQGTFITMIETMPKAELKPTQGLAT